MKGTMKTFTAIALLALACGGVPDTSDPDNYPLEVTRTIGDDGVEHVETRQLPFDYEAYGQAQQALSGAPPNRYGIDSAKAPTSSDTRCPSGGYTSGTNYCTAAGTKHINWDVSGVDGRADATLKIRVRDYVIQGLAVAAQDAGPSGFQHEKENPLRGIDGHIRYVANSCPVSGTSGFGYMCETSSYGPVTTTSTGGRRTRLSTASTFVIKINPDKMASLSSGTASQQALTVLNFTAHEIGHSEEFGHVPSAEGAETMNLQTGQTNQQTLHLSSAEKSQLSAWTSSF
jgi:hypothetical protein